MDVIVHMKTDGSIHGSMEECDLREGFPLIVHVWDDEEDFFIHSDAIECISILKKKPIENNDKKWF